MTTALRASLLTLIWALATLPASAAQWIVDPGASRIAFSGTHAGRAFTGAFGKWSAEIEFDADSLATSKAVVKIDLSSAATGDVTYDKTLPTADWLNSGQAATATFETSAFRTAGPGKYEADGTLELRGVKVPVTLAFDLKIDGDTARVAGNARLKRLDFGIGKGSDATGAWVSLEIPVQIELVAKRKQ